MVTTPGAPLYAKTRVCTQCAVGKDHLRVPVEALRAYTLESSLPTYSTPSMPSVGDDTTGPSVGKLQSSAPVAALSAYTLKSLQPRYTTGAPLDPNEPAVGDE
jgi:hypothetical protein